MIHQKVPITDRKIRFALAGCGRISSNHMDALKRHSDRAELVAVCDVDRDALRQAAKRTGAQPFTSFSEMLESTAADVIVLATPSGLHADQAIRAAAAAAM